MAMPFVMMISANVLFRIKENNITMYYLLLFLAITPPLALHYQYDLKHTNDKQLFKTAFVTAYTEPDDYVYDGFSFKSFNLFRKDIDYFWYNTAPGGGLDTYQTIKDYEYNVYDSIDRFKPQIISSYLIKNMDNPVITKSYKPSGVYEDLYIKID